MFMKFWYHFGVLEWAIGRRALRYETGRDDHDNIIVHGNPDAIHMHFMPGDHKH